MLRHKFVWYVISFLVLWWLVHWLVGDRIWMDTDRNTGGELMPEWELNSEAVSGVKFILAFIIHCLVWLSVGLFILVKKVREWDG